MPITNSIAWHLLDTNITRCLTTHLLQCRDSANWIQITSFCVIPQDSISRTTNLGSGFLSFTSTVTPFFHNLLVLTQSLLYSDVSLLPKILSFTHTPTRLPTPAHQISLFTCFSLVFFIYLFSFLISTETKGNLNAVAWQLISLSSSRKSLEENISKLQTHQRNIMMEKKVYFYLALFIANLLRKSAFVTASFLIQYFYN